MQAQTSVIEFPDLKRTRRYGAKVKTGCITCKIRRIRCDEAKPACTRCTSTGRKCDGYVQPSVNQSGALDLKRASIFRLIKPTISGPPDSVHYLEFYHRCARQNLSSRFDNGFWSRIAPQLAQSELSVRHALIALGYLNKMEPGSIKHARSGIVDAHNGNTLYFHYNKAVKHLVQRIAEPSYTAEVGLVTCLLFVCIEFLRGDCFAAFMHLNSGLKLLNDRQQLNVSHSSPIPTGKKKSLPTRMENLRGTSTMIEDLLIPMFNRATTAGIIFGASVEDIWKINMARIPNHEQPFTSIAEAQNASIAMRNSSAYFIREMGIWHFHLQRPTATEFEKQAQLLEYHRYWFRAMEKFERNYYLSEEDKVIAGTLHMYAHTTYVGVSCAMTVRQMQYDAHLETFKIILHHAKIVLKSIVDPQSPYSPVSPGTDTSTNSDLDSPSPQPQQQSWSRPGANFTFEINLIPCLALIAHRCRCPSFRREVLSLLGCGLPREALWDADQQAALVRRIIDIEESEVDERGWPVERTRVWAGVVDTAMDQHGGFWAFFTHSECAEVAGYKYYPGRTREDAQWQEWLVL